MLNSRQRLLLNDLNTLQELGYITQDHEKIISVTEEGNVLTKILPFGVVTKEGKQYLHDKKTVFED